MSVCKNCVLDADTIALEEAFQTTIKSWDLSERKLVALTTDSTLKIERVAVRMAACNKGGHA